MKCKNCKDKFEEQYGPKQGVGCASHCYVRKGKHYILSSYGSDYDGDLFLVDTDKFQIKLGLICDRCIGKYVENTSVAKVTSGNYMGINYPDDPDPGI